VLPAGPGAHPGPAASVPGGAVMSAFLQNFFNWGLIHDTLGDLLTYGLRNTLVLALCSMVLGSVIGMVLAVRGISSSTWLGVPARVYTDLFRGLPAALTILM